MYKGCYIGARLYGQSFVKIHGYLNRGKGSTSDLCPDLCSLIVNDFQGPQLTSVIH